MEPITFDGRGPLAAALRARGTAPSVRQAQQEYAAAVTSSLDGRYPAFLDAETGVGKTLGYLLPVLEAAFGKDVANAKVIISTATVALQRQLVESDIPLAIDAFQLAGGPALSVAWRVGRKQVVELNALLAAIENHASPEDHELADDIAAWVMRRRDEGVLPFRSDLVQEFAARLERMPLWLSPDLTGLGATSVDPDAGIVGLYEQMIADAQEADVLVVNHHLFALSLYSGALWEESRPYYMVLDEADRLNPVVVDMGRPKVPFMRLRSALVDAVNGRKRKEVANRIDAVIERVSSYGADLPNDDRGVIASFAQLSSTVLDGLRGALDDCVGMIEEISRSRTAKASMSEESRAELRHFRYAIGMVQRLLASDNLHRGVFYCTPVRTYPGVASIDPGASRILAARLWRSEEIDLRGLVFTSATLGTLGNISTHDARTALRPFVTDAGFRAEEVHEGACQVISPRRFGTMDFVRPALNASLPFIKGNDEDGDALAKLNPDAVGYWAEMVRAASKAGGRVLVLHPAYRDLLALADELGDLGDRLVVQSPGVMVSAARSRFMAREDTVWLSASVWEGLSLPGAISHVVIPRLPLRPAEIEDRLIEDYYERVTGSASRGRSMAMARKLAEARRRLRQGIGRGIRAHDDHATIWIADPRWPMSQVECDQKLLDQPRPWSGTMANAVPTRFRQKLESSPRFMG